MFHLLRRFFPMQRHHSQWRGIRHPQEYSVRAPLGAASVATPIREIPRVPSEGEQITPQPSVAAISDTQVCKSTGGGGGVGRSTPAGSLQPVTIERTS